MKGKMFDDIISKKLANLSPKADPNSWELFEHKLDSAMSAGEEPSLPDQSFDEMIFGKLSKLQTQNDPKAWTLFQKKLDQATPEQALPSSSFDQMIATQLKRQQPAYNHSHWLLLQKRLDWISFVTNRLALYKLSELAVLLVLLFYLGQTSGPSLKTAPADGPIAEKGLDNSGLTNNSADAITTPTNNPQAKLPAEAGIKQPLKVVRPLVSKKPPTTLASSPDRSSSTLELMDQLVQGAEISTTNQAASSPKRSQLINALLPLDGVGIKVLPESAQAVAERFALSFDNQMLPQTSEAARLEELTDLAVQPLVPERYVSLASLIKPHSRKAMINFSMMGAFDYNRILTPENKEFRLTEFDRYEAGYGGGFLVGIEKGRLGIQTGGVYSFKHVRPIRVAYLEGSFDRGYLGEVLKEYDYSTISVPVNITYDLIKSSDWRVYAVAGASLNVVYESNYYVVLNRGKNSGGYGLAGSNFGPASTATTRTQLDEVKFPRGWFQGGSFAENSYLTTNIGFGVERFLEDRWSIFAQPTYQHGVIFLNEGLGPFKDQLRTMSFFTGIRVRLIK